MAFSNLLIANRGEIACRIIRTARACGLSTIAVYSDADAAALHVRQADRAVRIGGAPAGESYLDIAAIVAAARQAGADAVHPGYGFLAENAAFAEACIGAGLAFVGPPPAAIRAMGNKAAAKRLMQAAGVPCIPGCEDDQDMPRLLAAATALGFPLLVKAAAGGGGRGMRLANSREELAVLLAPARAEAAAAFGSSELILERAIRDARHVEIQIFADAGGAVVHLFERECSVQRRHQKVIEEAPSPAVTSALRDAMGDAAVAAARAVGYIGAGTVEFLLDGSGNFYFLEMNTRIQVEHPVTEAVTGIDLVAWQLAVAAGAMLPLRQEEITLSGHAMEARLYAEDPGAGFLPQSGDLAAWRPPDGPGIRVDHGLLPAQRITEFYDPLIAKVIAWGTTRDEARMRLAAALDRTVALGPPTNRRYLAALLRHPAFAEGRITTGFIEQHLPPESWRLQREAPHPALRAVAASLLFRASATACEPLLAGWHSTGPASWPMLIEDAAGRAEARVTLPAGGSDDFAVALGGETIAVRHLEMQGTSLRCRIDGVDAEAAFAFDGDWLHLATAEAEGSFRDALFDAPGEAQGADGDHLTAPMNGRIVAVLAAPGERVRRGQRIVVLEAMKMLHEIAATRAGTVERIAVRPGEQVAARQFLAALAAEEEA